MIQRKQGHLSDKMRVDEELRKSEERYRKLVELSPEGIVVHRDGIILFANKAAFQIVKAQPNDLIGKNVYGFIHPDERGHSIERMAQLKTDQDLPLVEKRLLQSDGRIIFTEITSMQMEYEGSPAVLTLFRDITDRKKAEDDLRNQEALYRLLTENSSDIVALYGPDGETIFVSPACEKILGYTQQEYIELSVVEAVHEEDLMTVLECRAQSLSGNSSRCVYRSKKKNGEYIWLETITNPVLGETGDIIQIQVTSRDIHQQKLAQDNYQLIANNMTDLIGILDAEGRVKYASPSYQTVLGYSPEILEGNANQQLVHHEDRAHTQEQFIRMLQTKTPISLELRYQHQFGHYLTLEATFIPVLDKSGSLEYVLSVSRDISTRKKMQGALLKKEESLTLAQKVSGMGSWDLDLETGVLEWSDQVYCIYGYTQNQIKVSPDLFYQHLYPEDLATVNQVFGSPLQEEKTYRVEHRIIRADGQVRWVSQMGKVVQSNPGVSTRFIGTIQDVTEIKHRQEEIEQLKRQKELILHSAGDGIFGVDLEENIIFVNPAGATLLGFEEAELIGKSLRHAFGNSLRPSLFDDKIRYVTDELFFRKDGTSFPAEYVSSPIWENGRISGGVVAFKDISEKRMAEEYLLKSEKLELAGQLAAGVAHEIRNPLTSIKGFIQLLEIGLSKPEYFSIMRSEFERIEDIINEFLALSKPQSILFQPERIDELLSQMIQLMNSQAILHNAVIIPNIDRELPSVYCDKNKLKQVFINVIKNAIEATEEGGVIRVEATTNDNHRIIVRIIDYGCGIPEHRFKNLFEPFYSTKEKGTGIGLMVSFKIIQEHQGSIQIESQEGKGTTVTITLPQYHATY
ncbi:PAS domain S-box protein [Ammoniphilus sp. YIM 78166]|uniref:PAS domain S-box protein n=1 Tax=Ammoniphilus sp. YIM 78166 TaxID=1644106 RepID=UPI0010703FCB|nr:PAS domain S-box protein [Ammoniphilus sp. YIM 78166]